MKRGGVCAFCVALAAFLLTQPAAAQVTTVDRVMAIEKDGKLVFVNDGPVEIKQRAVAAVRSAVLRSAARAGRKDDIPSQQTLERMASETAERHLVDPALVHAMIGAESAWNPYAVSSKGARGLMQLMPDKASELGIRDSFDPEQNLEGGVRHLRSLLIQYDGDLDLALAAYNAGSGAVSRAGGVPNYRETRDYVRKITDAYFSSGTTRRPYVVEAKRAVYAVVSPDGKRIFTNE